MLRPGWQHCPFIWSKHVQPLFYNDKYILKTRPISEPLPYIGKD